MDDLARPDTEYRFVDWRYLPKGRQLIGPAGEVRLKPLPDRLLRRLLDEAGNVLSREQLIEQVWTRREVNDEVLSRAIAELRALLGDDARAPRFVETLSKGGYRWIAPVTRVVPPASERTEKKLTDGRVRWLAATMGAAVLLSGMGLWWHARRQDRPGSDPAALAVGLLGVHPLTADPRLEIDARFDATGRVVYIRTDPHDGGSELVLVDPVTLAERVLWQDASTLRHPAPSPNGREIALLSRNAQACELWSVTLLDLHRTRLGDCAPTDSGGLEWVDGGDGLIYTGAAADAAHAPGLVLLDRRSGARRSLTTPDIAEGAHVDPRVSNDGKQLAYASRRAGEEQLWRTDWPRLRQRNALLKRPEPVYGHAFEPDGDALWLAGDLVRYRALHRLRNGGEPELIGGRGALSIDLARNGAAVWSEAIYDADTWLHAGGDGTWTAIARSNRYESQPEFSADGSHLALVSNRNGSETVLVFDRGDASVRALSLNPQFCWVRPTWSARDGSLILTAYEDRHARLYRYRLDGDVPSPLPQVQPDAFHGTELADRLVYLSGHNTGHGTLMQLREGQTLAENIGLGAVSMYRASQDWLVWRTPGTTSLKAARWHGLQSVREIPSDDDGEAFALTGNALYFVDHGKLWTLRLPDGAPVQVETERVPDGSGPSLAVAADGSLAVTTLTSLSIDMMIADRPARMHESAGK